MFKIITLPFDEDMEEFDQDRLEREFLFALKNCEIKKYKPELVEVDGRYYWTVFLEYEKVKKIESEHTSFQQNGELKKNQNLEKKSLPEAELQTKKEVELYKILREWRREQSDDLGYPPYIIASNRLLVEIIKARPKNSSELSKIKGMGEKKTREYGREILLILENFFEADD